MSDTLIRKVTIPADEVDPNGLVLQIDLLVQALENDLEERNARGTGVVAADWNTAKLVTTHDEAGMNLEASVGLL